MSKKWKRIIFLSVFALLLAFVALSAQSGAAYSKRLIEQSTVPTLSAAIGPMEAVSPATESRDSILGTLSTPEGFIWNDVSTVSAVFSIPTSGCYQIQIDYLPLHENYETILIDLSVDGIPAPAAQQSIPLYAAFGFESMDFAVNDRGDELYPEQYILPVWLTETLRHGTEAHDASRITLDLSAGEHILTLAEGDGAVQIGAIRLIPAGEMPTYEAYRAALPDAPVINTLNIIQAEKFSYKNKNAISLVNNANPVATPYDTHNLFLNTIDGKTFKNHMDRLAYVVDIPETGYYALGLKAAMPGKTDSPVFIDIEIDGSIPFDAFQTINLPFHKGMYNHLLQDTPVYLTQGTHEIAILLNDKPYHDIILPLQSIVDEVSALGINLQKISGGSQDKNREWVIADYLPNMVTDLKRWNGELAQIEAALLTLTGGVSSEEIQNISIAMRQIEKLIAKPNDAPKRLALLSQGSSSALQVLSKVLLLVHAQSLSLDAVLVGLPADPAELPITTGNYAFAISETAKQLARSFSNDAKAMTDDDNTIEIWVKRSRQYVDVLASLTEESFTLKNGTKVRFSLFTDISKLTLANAAGRQPDLVLGLDSYAINDLALRGSLTDLRGLPGINDYIGRVAPGSLLQMIIDDGLYGLPETQSFSLLFYRKDILDAYGWKVPSTWQDVTLMLSALQRSGMNFYTPLASSDAFKSWPATMPFFAQFGSDIFSTTRVGTAISEEAGIQAMSFMTNLFKIYGMPMQVASFYNDFRSGRIPIGVAAFSTYLELTYGAPELTGHWSVALTPGIPDASGEVQRWTTGGSNAVCIFEASDKKAQAWEFLQWWLATDTQVRYAEKLQNMYGQEFLWLSGNLEALAQLPIPKEHLDVVMEQIQWIHEAPKIPGGYYTERQVSDAFSHIVYDGMDVRSAMDQAAMIGDREIERKLREFKYMDDQGVLVKPYTVPSIEQVRGWLDAGR